MLAVLRPSDWEWLLFVHVAAALLLLGGLTVVAVAGSAAAGRGVAGEVVVLHRLAYRASLLVALPSFAAMIAAGEALSSREGAKGTWLDLAYPVTYLSALLGGAALTAIQRRALQRAHAGDLTPPSARIATALATLTLCALLLVTFLMTAKPGA